MLDTKKDAYTREDLQLAGQYMGDHAAWLSQQLLLAVLSSRHLSTETTVLKALLLTLYNSERYPFALQDLYRLTRVRMEMALELIRDCIRLQKEPHVFFENGAQIFSNLLPKWGGAPTRDRAPESINQQQFLRDAMATLKLSREQMSQTLGCSQRGLDKWLLPNESQDFRAMSPQVITQVKTLLKMGPAVKDSLLPENGLLAMGLVCKAFAALGKDELRVSASLSVDNPDGIKEFGDFQKVLVMAYREGAGQRAESQD